MAKYTVDFPVSVIVEASSCEEAQDCVKSWLQMLETGGPMFQQFMQAKGIEGFTAGDGKAKKCPPSNREMNK